MISLKIFFFGLDKESVAISPDGGSVDVIVYSNYRWEISGTSDWCTPSVKGGDANEDGQKVTFSADVTYDDREATFWFRCADKQIKFVVLQRLKEVIIPDTNNIFNIPAEGGVAVISYQTSVDCEVIIPEEAQDWITTTTATRGLVSESITLDIAENTTYSARTAVIKVVAKDNAELAVEYTINQEQNDAILANGNTEFTIDGWERQITIKHKANIDCDVIIPDDAQNWITIAPATRGLSTYSTTLNIAENNSGKERSCVVKVTSQGDNELFAEYTITQNSRYCLYYTSSNGKIVTPYDSSSFGATILSNTYIGGVGTIDFNAPITMIGEYAFYKCSNLTSVTIPNSVTTIGRYAFDSCSGLTSVTIPDSVTEIGYYAFAECSSLTSVTIGDSVTTIGGGAFTGCNRLKEFKGKFASEDGRCLIIDGTLNSFAPVELTEYTIPNSVTSIGNSAFRDCSSLTSVTIPDSVTTIGEYAFCHCSSLTSITIPDSVTTIGNETFYNCDGLTSITIPDSVTEIGEGVFKYCSNLTSATIPDSVTSIGEKAFYGCSSLTSITIPDSVTTIGNYAFYYCSSLTSVTIPDSVTMIGERAFYDCDSLIRVYISDIVAWCNISFSGSYSNPLCYAHNLYLNNELVTDLIIPNSVTTIGNNAFWYCSSLTSVTIPDSVTEIGYEAFYGCTGELIINSKIIEDNHTSEPGWLSGAEFTKLTIGNSVTSIGSSAFCGCSSLTSVTIPDSVTTIGDDAFRVCSSLISVTIPDSVTTIGNDAFAYCYSLTSVTIPDSVTWIRGSTFYNCSNLKSVAIPDSVTTIGNYAFAYCNSLTSITIPNSVTTIEDRAFYRCSSLTSVYCKPTTPPTVTLDYYGYWCAFDENSSGREIYVPMESVNKYKSASYWSDYRYSIEGYNF